MDQYAIHAAKIHLTRLVERARAGEEIVITQDEKPVARLVPIVPTPSGRIFGILKGQGEVDEAFFSPLPEEELNAWKVICVPC